MLITTAKTIKELKKISKEFKGARIEAQNISRCHLYGSLGLLVGMKMVAESSKQERKALKKTLKNTEIKKGVSENHRLIKYRFPNLDDSTRNRYVRLLDYRDEEGWGVEVFLAQCHERGIQNMVNEYMKGKKEESKGKKQKKNSKKSPTKVTPVEAKIVFAKPFKTSAYRLFAIRTVKCRGKDMKLIDSAQAEKILKQFKKKK